MGGFWRCSSLVSGPFLGPFFGQFSGPFFPFSGGGVASVPVDAVGVLTTRWPLSTPGGGAGDPSQSRLLRARPAGLYSEIARNALGSRANGFILGSSYIGDSVDGLVDATAPGLDDKILEWPEKVDENRPWRMMGVGSFVMRSNVAAVGVSGPRPRPGPRNSIGSSRVSFGGIACGLGEFVCDEFGAFVGETITESPNGDSLRCGGGGFL